MAVHYEVPAGQVMTIAGPANVTVKGGEVPLVVDSLDELQAAAPTLTALSPDTSEIGAADFVLAVSGDGFTDASVIVFGTYDEPTTLQADGTLTTGVKPSLFNAPDTVPVKVRNGPAYSTPMDFEFTAPGTSARKRKSHA